MICGTLDGDRRCVHHRSMRDGEPSKTLTHWDSMLVGGNPEVARPRSGLALLIDLQSAWLPAAFRSRADL